MQKPRISLCHKMDVDGAAENAKKIADAIHAEENDTPVIAISVHSSKGMGAARNAIIELVDRLSGESDKNGMPAKNPKEDFLSSRSVDESMEIQYPGSGE